MKRVLLGWMLLTTTLLAQQPQTSDVTGHQAIQNSNAKWVNGVAPGYAANPPYTGLTFRVGPGTLFCGTSKVITASENIVLTDATVNYVYHDCGAAGVIAKNTTGWTTSIYPFQIYEVTTAGGVITVVNDVRSWFVPQSSGGITSLNGLTGATQTFATGTTGTDFGIVSSGTTHTFNIPTASASNRGLLSTTDWALFNAKLADPAANGYVVRTSAGVTAARTFSATPPITVSNGDGTGGNSVIACASCSTSGSTGGPPTNINGFIIGAGVFGVLPTRYGLFDQATTYSQILVPMIPGYVRNTCVYVRTLGTGSTTRQFLRKNDTIIPNYAVTPTAAGTSCSTNTWMYVENLDTVEFGGASDVGASTTSNASAAEVVPTDNYYMLVASGQATCGAGTTCYVPPFGGTGGTAYPTVNTKAEYVIPFAGTLDQFAVSYATSSTQTNTMTVHVNETNTSITVNYTSGQAGLKQDLVNTKAVSKGDRVTFQTVQPAGAASGVIGEMRVRYAPSAGGCNVSTSTNCKGSIGGTIALTMTAGITRYCTPYLGSGSGGCSATEANQEFPLPFGFVNSNCQISIDTASSGGNTVTGTPMYDGVAATNATVSVTSGATGTVVGTGSDTISGGTGHYYSFRLVSVSGTGPIIGSWSCGTNT